MLKLTTLSNVIAALNSETAAIRTVEPQEIRTIRTGALKVGTNNQFFTTWDFTNSLLRDLSAMTWYPLLLTFEDKSFTLQQACVLAGRFDTPYTNFLKYSGFPKMGEFSAALMVLLPVAATREEAITAVRAFLGYLNCLTAWSFHTFAWGLGGKSLVYTPPDANTLVSMADLSRRVAVQPTGLRAKLTWQPLNISVVALLATEENPELVGDLVAALPFTVLQDHAVVSGQSMYAWAPIISTAPVQVKERQCDAPIGRIRYSQGTGNKVIIQYGIVTEDVATPVLGEILPEFKEQLAEVGRAVLESTFQTKDNIMLTIELMQLLN
ncbi:rcorf13 [Mycena metata]|uniref:Rcorf13 n=1 Tax=Mycena metata TaxID=1033252 RepID=A0AAD7JUB2_9AGAR|nr:rcorf13 [Mycena metata]